MKHTAQTIICTPKSEMQEIAITGVSGELVSKIILLAGHSGTYSIRLRVDEKNSRANLLIVPLLWDHQVIDLNVMQHHVASDTTSSVYLCGALADHARITCCCTTKIERGLNAVRTVQQSSLLMLSSMAKAKVVPGIASYSKEVESQHGAAIGSFDQEQLRLLFFKGIPKKQAKELLLKGFLNDCFSRIGADDLPLAIQKFLGEMLS